MRRMLFGLALTSVGVLSSCGQFGTLVPQVTHVGMTPCTPGIGSNSAPVITGQHSTAALPSPTGLAAGQTILPGVYYLTATMTYGQADDQPEVGTFQTTAFVSDNTMEDVVDHVVDPAFPGPESRVGNTYVVSGTNLLMTMVCSSAADTSQVGQTTAQPFSYADGVLKLYDIGPKKESVYTKQ